MPACILPVPTTVSPQIQKIVGAPISPTWNAFPKTAEEWKAQVNAAAAEAGRALPAMRDQLRVKSEPVTIDGVKSFVLTPEAIPPENRNPRIPAAKIEAAIVDAVRRHIGPDAPGNDTELICSECGHPVVYSNPAPA